MPSVHEQMIATSARPLHEAQNGVEVTLEHFSKSTAPFQARRSEQVENFGSSIDVVMRLYRLPTDKVVIDGNEYKPKVGDRIREGDKVFSIEAPKDKPAVELKIGDNDWLVYTKRVE